ncbi:unnamed protein product, partial [Rotaria sp. Silwood2]
SSSIKDLAFYDLNFQLLKESKIKYSILQSCQIDAIILIKANKQKIDLFIGALSINIDPPLIKKFATLTSSIKGSE